jgi:hypothetical protein
MNRTWSISVMAVLVGAAIGLGSSWYEYAGDRGFGFSKPLPANDADSVAAGTADHPLGRARVAVEGDGIFDFGVMSKSETRSHTFVVQNTGTIPLTLRFLEKSCQCTDVKMSGTEVLPGGSVEIELAWQPNDYRLEFAQTARFLTNDPARLELDLTVKGRVQQLVRPVPLAVSFGNVLSDDRREVKINVFGYRDADLSVENVEFLRDSSVDFMQAEIEPLSPAVLEQEPGALSGSQVTLRLSPGLPLGPFHQQLRLHLNKVDLNPIEIPVEGAIVGNVTIVGPDFDGQSDILKLGTLPGDAPIERQLWVLIKGEAAAEGRLRVKETDPAEILQVTLGEPSRFGNLTRQSMTVRIVPPGRVVNRLGSRQGELGRILLASPAADGPTVLVYVSFALEGTPE